MIVKLFTGRSEPPAVPGARAIMAMFVIALVYLIICMNREVNVYDEGLILFDPIRVLNGDLPHRDFYVNYGPAQFYVLAALYKIFGASVLIERAWDIVVRASIVVLVLIVVGQAAPRRFAFLAAAFALACLASVGAYGYPVYPCLAGALASLAILAPAMQRPRPWAEVFLAGVCSGVILLFRYDIGIAIFGVQCALLAFYSWVQRSAGIWVVIRKLFLLGAGLAIVVVPVAVVFVLSGVVADLISQIVSFSAKYYFKTRSFPFPRLWMLRYHPDTFAVYVPVLVCAGAVPVLITLAHRHWRGVRLPAASFTLLALLAFTLVFFAKGSVHVSVIHMSMALVSSLALVSVVSQPIPERGPAGQVLLSAALIVGTVFALSWIYAGLSEAGRNIAWAANPATWRISANGVPPRAGSCRVPAALERMACFPIDPAMAETILYVQQRTSPGDPIFVGLSRHDKIFINDILLYFLANRSSVTKWHQFDPGLQTSEPIQREMVLELRRAKPKLIVIEDIWTDWTEPNESAVSSGVTVLDDYLKQDFEPVARFGVNTILRPRS